MTESSDIPLLGIELFDDASISVSQDDGPTLESLWGQGRVEHIEINHCGFDLNDLTLMLAGGGSTTQQQQGLGAARHLKTLILDNACSGSDIDTHLIKEVLKSEKLERLVIKNSGGGFIDEEDIEKFLMQPNCVSTAELEYYVEVLDTDSEEPDEEDDEELHWHWKLCKKLHLVSLLNKTGRTKLRPPNGQISVLMELLTLLSSKSRDVGASDHLTLTFEILRANPNLWANNN